MALVSRIARVRITTATGAFREYTATAAVQDTPAGASVVVTVALTTGGTLPPDAPNNPIELNFYIDNGATLIKTVTFTPGTLPQNDTFFFTTNGLTGGAARLGTVRMRVRVEKTNGGPTATYHVDSDGTNNTPIALGSTALDQGWIRGTVAGTVTASNISAGGGKTAPAKFAEALYHRLVLAASSYASFTTVHTFTGTSKTLNVTGSTATRDAEFSGTSLSAGRVNEGFPAADATYTATVSVGSNSALTGLPWTVLTVTPDTLRVDPRLSAVWQLQNDQPAFGSPPRSLNESSGEMPGSSIGRVAVGLYDARGSFVDPNMSGGVNGLTVEVGGFSVTDPTVAIVPVSSVTATRGGEAGWSDFTQWTNSKPGGDWDWSANITAPSDIDDPAYLLGGEVTYTLIATRNPFVALIVDAGHASSSLNDRHMQLGDQLEAAAFLEQTKEGEEILLAFDAGKTPVVAFKRVRSGQVECWNGAAFVVANPGLTFLPMTQVSTYVWTYTVTTDMNWSDVIVQCSGIYQGVSYSGQMTREFVGPEHPHDQPETTTDPWTLECD